ncbi:hypothetical protein M406DRAFT_337666 [Cryphonectria parasitica EP155]|uniref:Uncharacterized protein n=1 Tax=Cryphonectria parasitica (strain ATCC 38755 / EP155) TaxID=660469 RepID=A0A9P4Y4C4_CRYP1|nr:uncharacterized protein M406DRAFT_337666 [Cryphonectria parasitica EP155]KAF3766719.1 hypothetical protein M406DRAFT_337666 [Cryphonectria parasitica EP155]
MFAPYQADPPEASRSPDIASPRASLERRSFSPANYQKRSNQASPPPLQHPQPQRSWQATGYNNIVPSPSYQSPAPAASRPSGGASGGDSYFGNISGGFAAEREGINEFDTSLGIRLDYEACLAYLALPPLGAILLLILERKSDYVRFHAWQSALLFTVIFILHLVFSWSTFFGWLFFLGDLALIAFLTIRAYRDADMLDRFEVPFFGQIASRFLDDE